MPTRITKRKMEILQQIADRIDPEKYYTYTVKKKADGFYLIPDKGRRFGNMGEFVGETFEQAKTNITLIKDSFPSLQNNL